jgi:hypothetical protein
MSKVVRVQDGDYKIITQRNGTITLDTGNQIGRVIVTGDLTVLGNTSTVNSETLTIKDNIVYLNVGEQGAGVTLETSGLTIERGTEQDVSFLFDETLSYTSPLGVTRQGVFKFTDIVGNLVGLKFNSVQTGGGDFAINTGTTGTGVISVSQVPDYEDRVTDDDDIPNKKFVNDYVAATGGIALVDRFYRFNLGTFTPYNTGGRSYDTGAGDASSKVTFEVDGTTRTEVTTTGLSVTGSITVGNLELTSNTITTTLSNANLSLSGNGTGLVYINDSLSLADQGSAPTSSAGQNKIYSSATIGTGGTGIKFVNTTTNGELISSKKALLYSLLF